MPAWSYSDDMPLYDVDRGRVIEKLDYEHEFERDWSHISELEQRDILAQINGVLDALVASPDPNWGSITNTSIEGGKRNPLTGEPGDWRGTPFQAIFEACNHSEDRAAMLFGNIWKWVIVGRDEDWIGVRMDPTFPNRGATLQGKTYFISNR
jgi:hypothetical protein